MFLQVLTKRSKLLA